MSGKFMLINGAPSGTIRIYSPPWREKNGTSDITLTYRRWKMLLDFVILSKSAQAARLAERYGVEGHGAKPCRVYPHDSAPRNATSVVIDSGLFSNRSDYEFFVKNGVIIASDLVVCLGSEGTKRFQVREYVLTKYGLDLVQQIKKWGVLRGFKPARRSKKGIHGLTRPQVSLLEKIVRWSESYAVPQGGREQVLARWARVSATQTTEVLLREGFVELGISGVEVTSDGRVVIGRPDDVHVVYRATVKGALVIGANDA